MKTWEKVREGWIETYRMKVPGGWLVKDVCHLMTVVGCTSSICFFPDQKHEWSIE